MVSSIRHPFSIVTSLSASIILFLFLLLLFISPLEAVTVPLLLPQPFNVIASPSSDDEADSRVVACVNESHVSSFTSSMLGDLPRSCVASIRVNTQSAPVALMQRKPGGAEDAVARETRLRVFGGAARPVLSEVIFVVVVPFCDDGLAAVVAAVPFNRVITLLSTLYSLRLGLAQNSSIIRTLAVVVGLGMNVEPSAPLALPFVRYGNIRVVADDDDGTVIWVEEAPFTAALRVRRPGLKKQTFRLIYYQDSFISTYRNTFGTTRLFQ